MHTGDRPPPGYYTDPDNPRVQRWWDGSAWAVSSRGTVATAPPTVDLEPPTPTTNPYATASLACSIGWVFFVGSVVGVILGHIAMAQISASEGTQTGRGSAMIGLIVGYIGVACGLLLAVILAG